VTRYPPPSPPFVGGRNVKIMRDGNGFPLSNLPIRRIVLHSTVSACVAGGARAVARYFDTPAAGGSAQYAVDPGEVVQIVGDSHVAEHAPPNPGSIGVEMCDMPTTVNANRWNDVEHRAMLKLTARLVAELCLAYDVRPYFVGRLGLKMGRSGVTTHNMVSLAFGQSSHWDPGAWPRMAFMREVRRQVRIIRKEHKK
jgi:hypothetical protein